MLRESKGTRPKFFKVWDHQPDHTLVEEATDKARQAGMRLDSAENRNLFLKAYNRKRLALASVSKALKDWDCIEPRTEPADTDILSNWLNSQSVNAVGVQSEINLDFKRPLVFDMIFIPDRFL